MKKIFLIVTFLVATASMAHALSLNYLLGSSPMYDGGYSFGSISFTDNASDSNRVDLNVTLANSNWKILGVYLNYDDAVLSSFAGQILTTDGLTIGTSVDGEKAGGYSAGYFDLKDPASGNLGLYGTYKDTLYGRTTTQVLTGYQQKIVGYQLKITGYQQKIVGYNKKGKPIYGNDLTKPIYGNDYSKPIYGNDYTRPIYTTQVNNDALDLNALDFQAKDSGDNFFAAIHIGNYGNCGNSIWVAAGDEPQPVPEPGTMVLFGIGMITAAVYSKRRRDNR